MTRIPMKPPHTIMVTPYDGLHRRSWTRRDIVKKQTFSLSRWSRLRYVHFVLSPNLLTLPSIKLFTGTLPFNDHTPHTAVLAIIEGRRPPRPMRPTFTEDLWMLVQRCWDHDPHLRPEASEALQTLALLVSSQRPRPVPMSPQSHGQSNDPISTERDRGPAKETPRRHRDEYQPTTHIPTGSRRTLGDYTLGKTLGVGSMGKVKSAQHASSDEKVCLPSAISVSIQRSSTALVRY